MADQLDETEVRQLREQMDKISIREALERHYHGLDSRDWEGVFAKCYTDDARMETLGGLEVHHGIDQILANAKRVDEFFPHSVHTMANVGIRLDGDKAESETFVVAYLTTQPDSDGRTELITRGIHYLHKWRRDGDGWRSYDLVHTPRWQTHTPVVDPHLAMPVMNPKK